MEDTDAVGIAWHGWREEEDHHVAGIFVEIGEFMLKSGRGSVFQIGMMVLEVGKFGRKGGSGTLHGMEIGVADRKLLKFPGAERTTTSVSTHGSRKKTRL